MTPGIYFQEHPNGLQLEQKIIKPKHAYGLTLYCIICDLAPIERSELGLLIGAKPVKNGSV